MQEVSIRTEPFDPQAEQSALSLSQGEIGAVVTFVGLMRDRNAGRTVERMLLEHYPDMTERSLAALVTEAKARWPVERVRIVHRVGWLVPGDPIVFVGVASRHREAAFRACEFLIDVLKTRAPFWKKELTDQGEHWVEARLTDARAVQRWSG
ncbi:molybdopterin synthase catalytic subunit MoaE [Caldichromatium japonicum]|uniref:Molybdopterin synthase catalytic subunit n=1 Tax=Caldichromatium japonicum TaxID=2699430 RepID=A0A6G7VE11_9GAMM|nr:molybdopterin synthase catalytic subunit MoaE [Caldichromatium japonicum]QIK38313.1 molybdopterin synthase catalytic subunit MoaE [Caldichromatium japonicum]